MKYTFGSAIICGWSGVLLLKQKQAEGTIRLATDEGKGQLLNHSIHVTLIRNSVEWRMWNCVQFCGLSTIQEQDEIVEKATSREFVTTKCLWLRPRIKTSNRCSMYIFLN